MRTPRFAARFERAGEAWDVALQIAALREQAGLSQKQLAHRLKTSQQQISRLESPGYEGHSLATLRRVAEVLRARVRSRFRSGDKRHRRGRGRAACGTARPKKKEGEKEDGGEELFDRFGFWRRKCCGI